MPDDDRGHAALLLMAALALVAMMMLGLAGAGRVVTQRAQARTAADAAALAGAAEGEDSAGRLAEANGAELVAYLRDGDEVVVKVSVDGVVAYGRARQNVVEAASGPFAGGEGKRRGLAPAMLAALARADALLGQTVPVVSGLRSREQQQALWDARASNPYPVAAPGHSLHERGLAVDVPRDFVARLLSVAAVVGLCHPLPQTDPVHFVVCGA